MRVCIYTAIFGGYDNLKPAAPQSVPTDFFCFTDGVDLTPRTPWIMRRDTRLPGMSPRMRAKWFKTHPHALFPAGAIPWGTDWRMAMMSLGRRYDFTIWIDGSLEIFGPDFAKDIVAQVDGSGLAVLPHPDRDCIYAEVEESIRWAKYSGQPLTEQVESYRREGYPERNGLAAAGVLVRATRASHLAEIDEAWWRENLEWSYQDQLSLPVVWWRRRKNFAVVDGHLWNNPWFRHSPHPREEGLAASGESDTE